MQPPGMPSVSSGTSAPPVSALLAPSGAATPSGAPCAELLRMLRHRLLDAVGDERRDGRAGARQAADQEADHRAVEEGEAAGLQLLPASAAGCAGPWAPAAAARPRRPRCWQAPRRSRTRRSRPPSTSMPPSSTLCPKVKRDCAVNRSVPMLVSHSPTSIDEQRLDQRGARQQHHQREAEAHQREIFRRAERQREGRDRRRDQRSAR